MSTASKMFFILTFALLPLGLIAILASVQSARENGAERKEEIHTRVQLKAQRISGAVQRSALTIRAASAAIALSPPGSDVCSTTLSRIHRSQPSRARYVLYAAGNRPACITPGFVPPAELPSGAPGETALELAPDGSALRFALFDERGGLEGYGEYGREALSQIVELPGTGRGYDLILSQDGRRMPLRDGFRDGPFIDAVDAQAAVDGGLRLSIHTGAVPIRPAELLTILLPIFMWIAAAIIGWIIVDRFILRPLARLQGAVSAYRPGDKGLDLPNLSTPAHEIRALGASFGEVTQTVARHEAELEAAVERQTRLVREVHHRVKNNLQVVASLLNLHARGATSDDVAAAYASIQRRVDALAVVHRNHYAELEENRGVALKPLISELAANLRATAPASAAGMQVKLDVDPLHATQDVAVSIAFLITEMVEFAMLCGASSVTIALETYKPTSALLTIASDSLKGELDCQEKVAQRFDRIVTGLARQLRTSINRDTDNGFYSLEVAVAP